MHLRRPAVTICYRETPPAASPPRRLASFVRVDAVLALALTALAALFTFARAQAPYQAGIEFGDNLSRHVTFDTARGYQYRIFTSEDLVHWMPIDPPFYGLGGEYSVHVLTVPEPGEPPGEPPGAPPHFHVLLTDLGDGDTLLSFTGDDGNPHQTLLVDLAFPNADPIGAYFDPVSEFQFTWMRDAGPHHAGYDSLPPLPAGEQVKVDAFIAAHDEVDQSGSATPGGAATQYVLGQARFWRVERTEIDTDSDGLPDWLEFDLDLSAFNADSDFNTIADGDEDKDGDGVSNLAEAMAGTSSTNPNDDSDGDGMPNAWENGNQLNPLDASDAYGDPDADGLISLEEYRGGSLPQNPNTDGPPAPFDDLRLDGDDLVPYDSVIQRDRLAKAPSYAAIPLGEGQAIALNNNGDAIFRHNNQVFLWSQGAVIATTLNDAIAMNDHGWVLGTTGTEPDVQYWLWHPTAASSGVQLATSISVPEENYSADATPMWLDENNTVWGKGSSGEIMGVECCNPYQNTDVCSWATSGGMWSAQAISVQQPPPAGPGDPFHMSRSVDLIAVLADGRKLWRVDEHYAVAKTVTLEEEPYLDGYSDCENCIENYLYEGETYWESATNGDSHWYLAEVAELQDLDAIADRKVHTQSSPAGGPIAAAVFDPATGTPVTKPVFFGDIPSEGNGVVAWLVPTEGEMYEHTGLIADPNAVNEEDRLLRGPIAGVNERLQAVTSSMLWHNGVGHSVAQLVADGAATPSAHSVAGLNNHGVMVATVTPAAGGGPSEAKLLLPVDIDVIHPATGELEETLEDYSGTGPRKGGLVALKRDEYTPVTKLRLHAIEGLPVGPNCRLRIETPIGSGLVKVWTDPQQTDPVISQETEFFARVSRQLYLEGVSVSKSASITITQEIDINGAWTDGDSVSLTVVHAEIPVTMRCFIPHAWTEGELPIPVELVIIDVSLPPVVVTSDCAGGNRQDYSTDSYDDEPEYKLRQEVIITPYKELHANVDRELERRKGTSPTTKFYKKSEDVPPSHQSLTFGESFVAGATANWTFIPPEPDAKYENIERVTNSSGNDVSRMTPSLSGEAGSPNFVPSAILPNIDFEFQIEAERDETSGVSKIYFTTNARHDQYPAYELNVGNSDDEYTYIYRYKPEDSVLPGPISLNSPVEGSGERKSVQ